MTETNIRTMTLNVGGVGTTTVTSAKPRPGERILLISTSMQVYGGGVGDILSLAVHVPGFPEANIVYLYSDAANQSLSSVNCWSYMLPPNSWLELTRQGTNVGCQITATVVYSVVSDYNPNIGYTSSVPDPVPVSLGLFDRLFGPWR